MIKPTSASGSFQLLRLKCKLMKRSQTSKFVARRPFLLFTLNELNLLVYNNFDIVTTSSNAFYRGYGDSHRCRIIQF
jgi:hypothetical protein